MAVLISLGIAAVVVAFVAAPLFLLAGRPSEAETKGSDASEALADLLAEKETIYAAIQELDFDLKSGKLSAEDHEALRQRHEAQAAAVLKRIDELQGATQPPKDPGAPGGRSRRHEEHPGPAPPGGAGSYPCQAAGGTAPLPSTMGCACTGRPTSRPWGTWRTWRASGRAAPGRTSSGTSTSTTPTSATSSASSARSTPRPTAPTVEDTSSSPEEAAARVAKYGGEPIREIHMVAGINPKLPYQYYLDLLRAVKAARPDAQIKAFTMIELAQIARAAKRSLAEILPELKAAGLTACPGGGAEVFSDRVHEELFRAKLDNQGWFDVARAVHAAGIPSQRHAPLRTHRDAGGEGPPPAPHPGAAG